MNIGSLYKVKQYFWLLFPSKEISTWATATTHVGAPGPAEQYVIAGAAWYSKRFNCEITYFCLDSIVVFLEEYGFLKKVLTSDGLVGWTWFVEDYNDCFEEVKTES